MSWIARLKFLPALFFCSSVTTAGVAYPQNPLLSGQSIYLSHEGVYKYDTRQTAPLWSSLAGIETFEPVLQANRLLVGSTQGLYALDPRDGTVLWHIETAKTLFTPSVAEHAFAGSLHGELYAIDIQTGQIAWRRQFDGWIYSPAIAADSSQLWSGGQAHEIYRVAGTDGRILQSIGTTQELVFSPVELGRNRIGVNLFNGKTLVIETQDGKVEANLDGNAQPTGLMSSTEQIYRSHRDGSLTAFAFDRSAPLWQRSLTPGDLTLHPAQRGYLLLSDSDRNLILFDTQRDAVACRAQPNGRWLLPLQLTADTIAVFEKFLQPPGLQLVQLEAECN